MGQAPDPTRNPVIEAELEKVHKQAWNAVTRGAAFLEHPYRGAALLLLGQILSELRALGRRLTPPTTKPDPPMPPAQPQIAQRRRGT